MQASYGCEFKDDDPYAEIRRRQLQKVALFVSQLTLDDNHPILVLGDFNVNAIRHYDGTQAESNEYLDMVHILGMKGLFSVRDVHKEFNGAHPVTHPGTGVKSEHSKGGQRLDFIFELHRNATRKDRIRHSFNKCDVLPFEIPGQSYTHISDHYASNVVLELVTKKGVVDSEQPKDSEREEIGASGLSIQLTL